jgi:hypothetical protein
MQMQWKDSRVKPEAEFAARNISDYLILSPSMLQKLWYPDIYIGEQPFLEASKSY